MHTIHSLQSLILYAYKKYSRTVCSSSKLSRMGRLKLNQPELDIRNQERKGQFTPYIQTGVNSDYFSKERSAQRLMLQLQALTSTLGDIVTTIDDLIQCVTRFDQRFLYSLSKDPQMIRMPSPHEIYQGSQDSYTREVNRDIEVKMQICQCVDTQQEILTSTLVDLCHRLDAFGNVVGHFGDRIKAAMFPERYGMKKEQHYKPEDQERYAAMLVGNVKTMKGLMGELGVTDATIRRWRKNYLRKMSKGQEEMAPE